MTDLYFEIVRFTLALHLEIDPDAIEETDHLADDLGVDPLDLVLVVLRLEELARAEFPVAILEHAVRVSDLVTMVREWSAVESERPTQPPLPALPALPAVVALPRRHESGIQPAASAFRRETGQPLRRAASGVRGR